MFKNRIKDITKPMARIDFQKGHDNTEEADIPSSCWK